MLLYIALHYNYYYNATTPPTTTTATTTLHYTTLHYITLHDTNYTTQLQLHYFTTLY